MNPIFFPMRAFFSKIYKNSWLRKGLIFIALVIFFIVALRFSKELASYTFFSPEEKNIPTPKEEQKNSLELSQVQTFHSQGGKLLWNSVSESVTFFWNDQRMLMKKNLFFFPQYQLKLNAGKMEGSFSDNDLAFSAGVFLESPKLGKLASNHLVLSLKNQSLLTSDRFEWTKNKYKIGGQGFRYNLNTQYFQITSQKP